MIIRMTKKQKILKFILTSLLIGLIALGLAIVIQTASARAADTPSIAASPLHPDFSLLDADGVNVLESGSPISTMQTCGQCHDTAFIESHSFHADVGASAAVEPGQAGTGRPWDTGEGLFGKWNPITYIVPGKVGLSTEEWIQTIGLRHVGGGPAEETGVEMNCFLCHLSDPDNESRIRALEAGDFEWANTATLAASQIMTYADGQADWNEAAFDEQGELLPTFVSIQDPANENCGQCHGTVHLDASPLVLTGCDDTGWETATTGMVFSSQRLDDSGMNLEDKEELTRSWDIHMERLVECTDCHFSLNNPVYSQGSGADSLDNLEFDPRRLEIGEGLRFPPASGRA